jgi:hypothetical protein
MTQYSVNNDNNTIKNVIFQGHRSANWYIRNFAGGYEKRANHNSVTVTLPNNQMLSTKHVFFVFRKYPHAQPGSMITLQMKPPKEKKVEGKSTDWDSILAKTVTSTTAILTLILLFKQL